MTYAFGPPTGARRKKDKDTLVCSSLAERALLYLARFSTSSRHKIGPAAQTLVLDGGYRLERTPPIQDYARLLSSFVVSLGLLFALNPLYE